MRLEGAVGKWSRQRDQEKTWACWENRKGASPGSLQARVLGGGL